MLHMLQFGGRSPAVLFPLLIFVISESEEKLFHIVFVEKSVDTDFNRS